MFDDLPPTAAPANTCAAPVVTAPALRVHLMRSVPNTLTVTLDRVVTP
jgi:hypothetical protein